MKNLLITTILIVGLCNCLTVRAQDSLVVSAPDSIALSTHIHFRHDRSEIEADYKDNRAALDTITYTINELMEKHPELLTEIVVVGSASPVGNEIYNRKLSLRRALKAEDFLRSIPGLEGVDIRVLAKGEDWYRFSSDIRAGYKRNNREELLSIIEADIPSSEKKLQIMGLESNSLTWRILIRDFMADSRYVATLVVTKNPREELYLTALEPISTIATAADTRIAIRPTRHSDNYYIPRIPVASVKTNLLSPGLNVGAELPLGNNWSVGAEYYFPWFWPAPQNKDCFELLGWVVDGRYWFGKERKPQDRLLGHSIGVYGAAGYYDFEKDYHGMQGEFFSVGLDYKYALPLGKKQGLYMEFQLALGYIHSGGTSYNVPSPGGPLFPEDGRVMWDYFGPTKASISLVLPIFRKNGGGRR